MKIWSPLGIPFGMWFWFSDSFFIALFKPRLHFFWADKHLCRHDSWPSGVRVVAYNCTLRCVSCTVACIARVSGVHSTRTRTPRSRWSRLATCFMSSGQVPILGGTENHFTASKESVYMLCHLASILSVSALSIASTARGISCNSVWYAGGASA